MRKQFDKWEKVKIIKGTYAGNEYLVEGYWDEITGQSWLDTTFNAAIMQYAMRTLKDENLKEYQECDEVLYGKIGIYGHLIHVTEVERIDK